MGSAALPKRVNLGQSQSTILGFPIHKMAEGEEEYPHGKRFVMGFPVPDWQRGLVWEEDRQIRLIESIWKGIPIGTYTYNQTDIDHPLDGLLIDGQQRMASIERYLKDEFEVFGGIWSSLPRRDQMRFEQSQFASYVTSSKDEDYLRGYYDLMNFGGVAHDESQRASKEQGR